MSPIAAEKSASLIQLSHDLGREDRQLAILGEGNTSCRLDAETFLVKASGSSISNLRDDQLVACRFSSLLPLLETSSPTDAEVVQALLDARVDPSQPRPSIEAVFHAYLLSLPGVDFVGHTHPVSVNAVLCAGKETARKFADERRFPDEIVCCGATSVLVPYVDPGIALAQEIRKMTGAYIAAEDRAPRLVLLMNHGLIALGDSCGSVLAATLMAEKAARIFAGAATLGDVSALAREHVARIDSRPDEHYRQNMLWRG